MPDYEAKIPPFGRKGAITATLPNGEMKSFIAYAGRQQFAIGFDENPFSSSIVTFPPNKTLEEDQALLNGFKAEKEAWIAAQRQEVEDMLGRALTDVDSRYIHIDYATRHRQIDTEIAMEIAKRNTGKQ